MGLYRLYSIGDTWITTAHPDRTTSLRASGSNHGKSPTLNVFARKGDILTSSLTASIELGRSLVKFDIVSLSSSVFIDKLIPSSSNYYLKLFNMGHADTVPASFDIDVLPLSRSWDEGLGIDDDEHLDTGFANWVNATSDTPWTTTGSDYITSFSASQHFNSGTEDLEVDVTQFVNEWLTGTDTANNGFLLKLVNVQETGSENYYRKAFHSRESKFVDRVPYLEARWNSVLKDNRHNFAFDQPNTLTYYNFVRGILSSSSNVTVQIKDSIADPTYTGSFNAGELTTTGIFTASITLSSTGSYSASFYDIWVANGVAKVTGTFTPVFETGSAVDINDAYTLNVQNLKRIYTANDKARLVVNVRKKDFVTHYGVVSTASLTPDVVCVERMYYSVVNDETGETVVPFGTGSSLPYTQLSYNDAGNYFDFWMSNLVPGFKYRLLFFLDINNEKNVIDNDITFKVK